MQLTEKQQSALVRFFQVRRGLTPDGIYGPRTKAALDAHIEECAVSEEHSATLLAIFESVRGDVGQREAPLGSNMGPYVEDMRDETGLTKRGNGQWCALLQSAHFFRYGIDIRHRGASGVVRELARVGRWVKKGSLRNGFVGLSQHPRGSGNHVRIFRVYAKGDKLWAHWIGGNEKHRVKEGRKLLTTYIRDVKKIATL